MMEKFLSLPHIPKGNISLAVVDGRIDNETEKNLLKHKIKIIKTKPLNSVDSSISYHPDIMLYHAGKDKIIVSPNISKEFIINLKNEGFNIVIGKAFAHSPYPYDVCYNVARVGNNLLCCKKYIDDEILKDAYEKNLNIIDIKQGYSKCSICIVNENAVITSDDGIAKKLNDTNIDCLKIHAGFIDLFSMNFGFIGGATGLISKDELAFYGNAALHPDFEAIKSFLYKRGKKHINLSTNKMMDMGTLIPLKEYSIL